MTRDEKIKEIYRWRKIELQRLECEHEDIKLKLLEKANAKIAAAEDDPEEEKPQPVQEPTVWLDGSQHSAVITARRILNKLPRLNYPQESFYIEILPSHFGGTNLDIKYVNTIDKEEGICSCELSAKDEPEIQAARVDIWLKSVDVLMAKARALKESEVMRKEVSDE